MELINSDQKIVAAFHPAGMSQVGQKAKSAKVSGTSA